uniref:Uncharacterized protein n=2 Tax=Rhodnius prolixus TaxID=13249 RepID=T1HMM6_RHOPR
MLFTLRKLADCVEIGVPERFLRPRNFNPHPYDVGDEEPPQLLQQVSDLPHPYRLFERPPSRGDLSNNGPVQFPKVPEAAQIQTSSRDQSPGGLKPNSVKHPLNTVLNSVNSLNSLQDFQALEFVPSSVGSSNLPLYDTSPVRASARLKSNTKPKNYAFSYAVKDGHSGDDFSHRQAQAGAQTMGEYRVKLPDGRTQVVSYTADHRGYRADVRYDEENLVEPNFSEYKPAFKPSYKPTYKPRYKPAVIVAALSNFGPTGGSKSVQPNTGDYTPIHEDVDENHSNSVTAKPTLVSSAVPPTVYQAQPAYFLQSTASPLDYYHTPTIKATYFNGNTITGQEYYVSSTAAPQIEQEYYPSSTVPPQYHGPSTAASSEHRYFLVR